jgi:hypothetical protein
MDEMFRFNVRNVIGQLHPQTPVGNFLNHTAKNPEYKTFLEFGTWNGQGSTLCIGSALAAREDPTVFVSLEADKGRRDAAADFWTTQNHGNMKLDLVWGKVSQDMLTQEYVNNHPKFSAQIQYYDIEVSQTASCPLIDAELPETVDVVLFDGGEFCGIGDYKFFSKKYPHVKMIICDDIDTIKNELIYNHLTQSGSPWKVIASGPHPGRPGREDGPQKGHTWAAFVRE